MGAVAARFRAAVEPGHLVSRKTRGRWRPRSAAPRTRRFFFVYSPCRPVDRHVGQLVDRAQLIQPQLWPRSGQAPVGAAAAVRASGESEVFHANAVGWRGCRRAISKGRRSITANSGREVWYICYLHSVIDHLRGG